MVTFRMGAFEQAVSGSGSKRGSRASASLLMAAIIGLSAAGIEASRAADGHWLPASKANPAKTVSLLAQSSRLKTDPSAPLARQQADPASYDPYTCAAAYGDTFCAEFERCMNAYGFDACYVRFNR